MNAYRHIWLKFTVPRQRVVMNRLFKAMVSYAKANGGMVAGPQYDVQEGEDEHFAMVRHHREPLTSLVYVHHPLFYWWPGGRHRIRPLSVSELATAWWLLATLDDAGQSGLGFSYDRANELLNQRTGQTYHRARIAATINALETIEWIEMPKKGGHSPRNGRGTVYEPTQASLDATEPPLRGSRDKTEPFHWWWIE